tara:strand:+ start:121 stop:744 length:624 start_codon:yes stop_codon:yes gene_type:complete
MNAFESYLRQGTEQIVIKSESGKSFKVEHWDEYRGFKASANLPTQEGWYVSYWDIVVPIQNSVYDRSVFKSLRVYEGPFEDEFSAEEAAHEMADAWDEELQTQKPRWTSPSSEGCICRSNSAITALNRDVKATEEYIDDNFKSVTDGFYEDAEGNIWEEGAIGETAREECQCDRCKEIRAYELKVLITKEKEAAEQSRRYDQFNYTI